MLENQELTTMAKDMLNKQKTFIKNQIQLKSKNLLNNLTKILGYKEQNKLKAFKDYIWSIIKFMQPFYNHNHLLNRIENN